MDEQLAQMGDTIKAIGDAFRSSGLKAISVILIFYIGVLIIRSVLRMVKAGIVNSTVDNSLVTFIVNIIRFCLYLALILVCLSYLGVALSGVLSAVMALLLAIGLSLQNMIASVAYGFMIATTHPFRVDDYVEAGGTAGTVKEINLLHTVLITPDGRKVYVPNSAIFANPILNNNGIGRRRMDITVSVDYASDNEKVREILLDVARKHPLVLDVPEPQDRWNAQGESAITHTLRVWALNSDYWTVNWDLNEQVTVAIQNAGIEIPFPQLTLSYRSGENPAQVRSFKNNPVHNTENENEEDDR